jgi:hypothetical protein
MGLDIAAHNASESPHELVYLARRGASNSVGDSHAMATRLLLRSQPQNRPPHLDLAYINGLVQAQKVDKVRPEGVLGREAHLDALARGC